MSQRKRQSDRVEADQPSKHAFDRAIEARAIPAWYFFIKCAQIIGVTVSDTTVDMAIANASVTENSRKKRPTIPPMKRSG